MKRRTWSDSGKMHWYKLRGRRISLAGLASVAVLASVGCAANAEDPQLMESREAIVGGVEAPEGDWPTVVTVEYHTLDHWCGGTIIGDKWVLTAAHCVWGDLRASMYNVFVGRHNLLSSDGQTVAVANIIVHPDYTPSASGEDDNDIAILELQNTVAVKPSRLVSPARMAEIAVGDDATMLGWGATNPMDMRSTSDVLRMVTLGVIGRGAACNAVSDYDDEVTNNMICIGDLDGGADTCKGDSGGPAFVKRDNEWFSLGVTSWGWQCAQAGRPGVYTYLPNYLKWVQDVTPGSPAPSLLSSAQISAVVL